MDPIRVGDILDGKYQIEGTLGEGAMGVVFSARHTALNKRVAVKTLRPEIARDQALVGRFEQEARAASAIGHPNIIEVFDLGSAPNGARYMVMEHLRGESLADVIVREPVQPLARTVFFMLQTLSALAAAHKRGIVHRDLKPENIFVVRIDDRPDTIKLLDFGISKVLAEVADPRIAGGDSGARQTKLGTVLGTPLYMSPEQARGLLDIDHRTDLWAVGVCLYEMLTGKPPFDGQNYNQIMGAILQGQFKPPSEVNPAVPPAMEQVIMKALAYQRERRYQSASEMRRALDGAAMGRGQEPERRVTAPTMAMQKDDAPAAAAAAVVTPPPGVAAPPLGGLELEGAPPTGLAAAGGATADDGEAAMLSALDKIASGEVAMSFAAASAPVIKQTPAVAPPPSAPSVPAPPRPAAPAEDRFAPPDADDEELALDLAVAEPVRAVRTNRGSQERRPVADLRASGAHPAGSRATVARPRGTSAGTIVVWLAALVVLGAGGLAGYRYLTLGYVLSPPDAPSATIALSLSPAGGEVIVDGLAFPGRELELEAGKPRTVRAMATGRLQHEVVIGFDEGAEPPPPLAFHLSHRLAAWTPRVVPAHADRKGPAAAAGMDAHDPAVSKLDRFRACLGPLGEALDARRAAYLAATRGKASAIQKNNIPAVEPVPADLLSTCRTATQTAATDQPRFPELDDAMLAVMPAVTELQRVLEDVAEYYREEKYRNDGLRWGRKMHPRVVEGLGEAVRVVDLAGSGVADRRAFWQTVELADIERREPDSAHVRLRRVAYAAQAWVGAVARGLPGEERAARAAALDAAYRDATAWAAGNADAMKQIDGAGIFLTGLRELVDLSRASGEATADQALALFNAAVERFNDMVL